MLKPAQNNNPLSPGLMFFQLSQPKTQYLDAPRALVYSLPPSALQVYLLLCDIAERFPHFIFSQTELAALAGLSRKTIGSILTDLDADNAASSLPPEARLLRRHRTDYGGYRYEILPPPADVQEVGEAAARWGAWRLARRSKNLPVNTDQMADDEPSAEYDDAYSIFVEKYQAMTGKDLTPSGLSWNWDRLLFCAQGRYDFIAAAILAIEKNGSVSERASLFEAVCARIRRTLAELALTKDSREQKLRHYQKPAEYSPEITQNPVSQITPCVKITQGGASFLRPPHDLCCVKTSQLNVHSNTDNGLQDNQILQSPKSGDSLLPLPPRKSIYTPAAGVLETKSGGGGEVEKKIKENEKPAETEPQKRTICKTDMQKWADADKPPETSPIIKPGDDETGIPRDVLSRADRHGLRSDVVRAWIATRDKHGRPFAVYDALAVVERYATGRNVGPDKTRIMFEGALIASELRADQESSRSTPLNKPQGGAMSGIEAYLEPPPPELVTGAAKIGVPPKTFLRAYHQDRAVCLAAMDALEESGQRIKSPAAAFFRNVSDKREPSTTYKPKWRKEDKPAKDVLALWREAEVEILAVAENNVGKFCEVKSQTGTEFRWCLKDAGNGRILVERWLKDYDIWSREMQFPLRVWLSQYRTQIPLKRTWKPLAEFPEAQNE